MEKNFATYNTLMRHMRNSGITISGSSQKQHLLLEGYFHGYKGYRYSKQPKNLIPFSDYSQIRAVIEFDESFKAIMYQPLMQLESAIKSVACDKIVTVAKSDSFSVIYDTIISREDKRQRLKVRNSIYASMTKRFCLGSPIVCHYYDKDNYVPL
jgi:abortive infection bacteriophage resistance protein